MDPVERDRASEPVPPTNPLSGGHIVEHLQLIVEEMRHGTNSHDDPNLPENWERLERAVESSGVPAEELIARVRRGETDDVADVDIDLTQRDRVDPAVTARNAEARRGSDDHVDDPHHWVDNAAANDPRSALF